MFQGKKAIIFDMDGTLIDSVGIWNQIDLRLIEKLKKDDAGALQEPQEVICPRISEEEIQKLRDDTLRQYRDVPDPYGEYCRVLKEQYGVPQSPAEIIQLRYEIAQDYLKNTIDYKPGAAVFLAELKARGFVLAIASTTKKSNMEVYRRENRNIMESAPIDDIFSLVYTREDVKEIKPAPEAYHKVMEALGMAPEDCLVFEDSLVGVEAAKAAGIETIAVYDKYSDVEREQINALADHIMDDYTQALDMLPDISLF